MRRARRSPRHPLHDYRQPGLYFVTVCTADRQPVFGTVRAGEMHRSAFGDIAQIEWLRTFEMRPYLVPDVFVVMPDHVHLLFGLMGGDAPDPRRRDVSLRSRTVCLALDLVPTPQDLSPRSSAPTKPPSPVAFASSTLLFAFGNPGSTTASSAIRRRPTPSASTSGTTRRAGERRPKHLHVQRTPAEDHRQPDEQTQRVRTLTHCADVPRLQRRSGQDI